MKRNVFYLFYFLSPSEILSIFKHYFVWLQTHFTVEMLSQRPFHVDNWFLTNATLLFVMSDQLPLCQCFNVCLLSVACDAVTNLLWKKKKRLTFNLGTGLHSI